MDSAWALEVMRKAPYITVSFTRPDGTAYGVPLSLASADGRIWYFHCAPEGDKLDALAVHPEVCLSAVTKCAPTVGQRRIVHPPVSFGYCVRKSGTGDRGMRKRLTRRTP